MDDYGGESPDHYGGGGGGIIHLVCLSCGFADDCSTDDYSEDGFISCGQCDAVHTSTQETAAEVPFTTPGAIRIIRPKPCIDEADEPRDFVSGAPRLRRAGGAVGSVRQRYVQGLQVMLQWKLEVLVERHRVGALVCGVAGTLWVRWVAASKVFDGMWAHRVLAEDDVVQILKRSADGGEQEVKCKWADDALPRKYDRRRVHSVFLRSLRMALPLYSLALLEWKIQAEFSPTLLLEFSKNIELSFLNDEY